MINLSPEDGQKLSMIIKAKLMPEQAKQQQQQGLLKQQNTQAQQQMGSQQGGNMPMPNSREAAMRGLLR